MKFVTATGSLTLLLCVHARMLQQDTSGGLQLSRAASFASGELSPALARAVRVLGVPPAQHPVARCRAASSPLCFVLSA